MSTVFVMEDGVVVSDFIGYAKKKGEYKPKTDEEAKMIMENSERIKSLKELCASMDQIGGKKVERAVAALQKLDSLQAFCMQIDGFQSQTTGKDRGNALPVSEIKEGLKQLGQKDFSSLTEEELGVVESELKKRSLQLQFCPEAMLYAQKVQMGSMKDYLGRNGWNTVKGVRSGNKAYMMVQTPNKDQAAIIFEMDGKVTVISHSDDQVRVKLHQLVEASLKSIYGRNIQGVCTYGVEAKDAEDRALQEISSRREKTQIKGVGKR